MCQFMLWYTAGIQPYIIHAASVAQSAMICQLIGGMKESSDYWGDVFCVLVLMAYFLLHFAANTFIIIGMFGEQQWN